MLLIFCALLLSIGCSKEDSYFKSDTMIEVAIVNENNEDLLNQDLEISDKIDKNKLKLESYGNNDISPSPTKGKLAPDILSPNYFTIMEVDGKNHLSLIFPRLIKPHFLKLDYNEDGFPPDELKVELINNNGTVV